MNWPAVVRIGMAVLSLFSALLSLKEQSDYDKSNVKKDQQEGEDPPAPPPPSGKS